MKYIYQGRIEINLIDFFYYFIELYIRENIQEIFTYFNRMDAGNFLFEFVVRESGVFLPKDEQVRTFVEEYFKQYKEIGNEVR